MVLKKIHFILSKNRAAGYNLKIECFESPRGINLNSFSSKHFPKGPSTKIK